MKICKKNKDEAKRRATKFNATPKWLTAEQLAEIGYYYTAAKIMETAIGGKYEVDHIIPLQGKTICGLHVPWNY